MCLDYAPVELNGGRRLEFTFHQHTERLEKVDGTSSRSAAGHQVASVNGVHVRTQDRY